MKSPPLRLAIALVRAWTRLYTWRMEPAIRKARHAEIESDLWEFEQDPDAGRRLSPAVQVMARVLLGVPACGAFVPSRSAVMENDCADRDDGCTRNCRVVDLRCDASAGTAASSGSNALHRRTASPAAVSTASAAATVKALAIISRAGFPNWIELDPQLHAVGSILRVVLDTSQIGAGLTRRRLAGTGRADQGQGGRVFVDGGALAPCRHA